MTALEQRKNERLAATNEQILRLESNTAYQDLVLDLEEDIQFSSNLNFIINEVNKIKPIITNDGSKYSVHCFALPQYIFGSVIGAVLGLVNVSGAMFTEERQTQFTAITGVSYPIWNAVAQKLGKPAYFNKGVLTPAIEPDYDNLDLTIKLLLQELNIPLRYADKANKNNLEKYFLKMEEKAVTQQVEMTKSTILDNASQFTIED